MGKVTTQSKDFPGFIANRILMPYINEAVFVLQVSIVQINTFVAFYILRSIIYRSSSRNALVIHISPKSSSPLLLSIALQEGIATREHIDETMKLGTNVPMGPLTLADFIGLDTCLAIMKVCMNHEAIYKRDGLNINLPFKISNVIESNGNTQLCILVISQFYFPTGSTCRHGW